MLYFGDSRTYTNINNLQLDTLLNTSSYNIAMWANWFPNQYAFLQDLLPEVPDGTTLIYSLGHQNFYFGEVQDSYPINAERAKEYYTWGFTIEDLKKPLRQSQTIPSPNLLVCHGEVNNWFSKKLKKFLAVVFSGNKKTKEIAENLQSSQGIVATSSFDKLKNNLANDPEVEKIVDFKQRDTITSYEVYWRRGNYWRVELDSLYFRNKQRQNILTNLKEMKFENWQKFTIDERYWKNFQAIIALLKKHQKRLNIIFNEVVEAPNQYLVNNRSVYEKVMDTKVKGYIQQNGFQYIKVYANDLPDHYYFDYNHLNNKGCCVYSARLADTLKTHLK
ncbi:MAG: hypothetical protein JNJ41_17450 [Bacteroidia bacterium]|nr:hypothetical protein [Bacteroidia bacterium]